MLNPAGYARNSNGEIISTGSYRQSRPTDPSVGNGALPAGFRGAQNRAYVREVQGDELSSNRISAILAASNPYITNARQRGVEQAASRGMLNSAAAAGAAERSAIEAASPLALQEAGAFGTAAGQNLDYLNQFALEGARDQRAEFDRLSAMNAAETAAGNRLQLQREALAFEGEQAGLNRGQQNYRDYTAYRYATRRDNNAAYNQRRDYAFRTGVDLRASRYAFMNRMMQAAIDDPELFTPEDVAGMMGAFDGYFDDMDAQFGDFYDFEFGDFYFGGY